MSLAFKPRHIPSEHDRMDPLERGLRWLQASLAWLWPTRAVACTAETAHERIKQGQSVIWRLPREMGFSRQLDMPPAAPRDHINALALRAEALLPLAPDTIYAALRARSREADGAVVYDLVAARREDLDRFEETARELGASRVTFVLDGQDDVRLVTDAGTRRDHTRLTVAAGFVVALFGALWFAIGQSSAALDREIAHLAQTEQALRSESVRTTRALRDARTANALAERFVLRGSLDHYQADLNQLSEALAPGEVVDIIDWSPCLLVLDGEGLGERDRWMDGWELTASQGEGAVRLERTAPSQSAGGGDVSQ
jgi:hypothetical protein